MSVIVRMEMPQSCFGCLLAGCYGGKVRCGADGDRKEGNLAFRPDWCPIRCELPEKHGRLVDADALLEQHKPSIFTKVTEFTEGQRSVVVSIRKAPTIVPATKEGVLYVD